MRASQRIVTEGAVYGPAILKTITQAFDSAWSEIEKRLEVQLQAEAFRLRLADAILAEADDNSGNVAALKEAALTRLQASTEAASCPMVCHCLASAPGNAHQHLARLLLMPGAAVMVRSRSRAVAAERR